DEPTGNLDTENGANIVSLLKSLAHEKNRCVIIVTHDLSIAGQADVVLRMHDGEVALEG
ncbi:MAG TPA: ABC transporter ATP-binding protein, partial [Firmicutes bacterium]|nr:ABC transporter ATP-binding protein [Bacillota bacterium]